jgi:hypothetical protein
MTFPHVEGMAWAGLNQSFFLQVQDLLPGTPYFELFRMSDAFGNWEFLKRDFTTLKRRIRVELGNLHISDDSDDLSNGEASFDFYVETGNIAQPGSWVRRGTLSYGNSNLETGKDATPAPSGSIVVGPEPVKQESRHVRFSVEGEEDDSGSFPLDDVDVGTASKDLLTPSGPDEVVSHRPDTISASGGDGWSFTLSYKYWIEYF